TNWPWVGSTTVSGVVAAAGGGLDLVRADARTGLVLQREGIPLGQAVAIVSSLRYWTAFSTSSPDAPGEAVTAAPAARVSSGPRTNPGGWLPDGHFVFVR